MTSLTPKYMTNLMTGDQGATHKLKPRSFNKSFSTPTSLPVRWSLLSGSAITIKYYLFSEVVEYIIPEYTSIITPLLHTPSIHPWQNLQTHTSSCYVLILMSCQTAALSSGSNSIPLADRTIGCFTSGLPRRSRRLQSGTSRTPVHPHSSPPLVEPLEFHGVCKGDWSRAPGDSSVNYNLWNIVTTYL